MPGDLVEQVDVAALALRGEVVPCPAAGLQHDGVARGRLGKGRKLDLQRIGKKVLPGQFREVEPFGRHGAVGRRLILQMAGAVLAAVFVVVADGFQAHVARLHHPMV